MKRKERNQIVKEWGKKNQRKAKQEREEQTLVANYIDKNNHWVEINERVKERKRLNTSLIRKISYNAYLRITLKKIKMEENCT
jgi:nitrate/nitrite-specific signal transduction histidine kinase